MKKLSVTKNTELYCYAMFAFCYLTWRRSFMAIAHRGNSEARKAKDGANVKLVCFIYYFIWNRNAIK